jgi:2-succinyl-5-enolpyruvyl-6-hydroxy-3-cyclohexene-1-carboxylate synthase
VWKHLAALPDGAPAGQVVVEADDVWDDPGRTGALRLAGDPVGTLSALTAAVAAAAPAIDHAWLGAWRAACAAATESLAAHLAAPAAGDSVWVPATILDALPDGGLLVAANSMAVRDVESFTPVTARPLRVLANRGAAGIDGTLSTAAGAAFGGRQPTVLLTGDLAFCHDLAGLEGLRALPAPLAVVVLNDAGGGIFQYLPYAGLAAFDRLFRTPTGLDLAAAAAAFGLDHRRAETPAALRLALSDVWSAFGAKRSTHGRPTAPAVVIEVPVDASANTAAHRALWAATAARIEGASRSPPRAAAR